MGDVSLHTGRFKTLNLTLLVAGLASGFFFTGVEGTLFFVSCLLLWLYFLGALVAGGNSLVLPWSLFSILLFSLFFLFALTLLWTPVPGYTQTMLWRQGALPLVFVALVLGCDEEQWRLLRWALMLLVLAALIAATVQFFSGLPPRATFLNKNSFAGFLLPLVFWSLAAEQRRFSAGVTLLVLLCSGFVFGLIGSRGVFLAVAVGGLAVLVLALAARVSLISWWRRVLTLGIGLMASMIATGLDLGRGLGRLTSLGDPWSAGTDRFVIWQGAWEMLKDAPWHGLGVGIYALAYPPYRDATDRSAGHFVHNDLLQLTLEAGWLAALIALATAAAFLLLVWRGVRCIDLSDNARLEILALAGGVIVIAFHSLFTFNFYVYSSLILVGIVLARIHYLLPDAGAATRRIVLSGQRRIWRVVLVLLPLFPLLLLATGTMSQMATQKALAAIDHGNNQQVFRNLAQAKRFWPTNDFNWYMEGEVIRMSLATGEPVATGDYLQLLEYAEEAYQHTMELNPLRASAPHKYGNLLAAVPDALVTKTVADIISLYRKALKIDPGYYPARVDLARLYAQQDEITSAHEVLEDGFNHFFRRIPDVIPYLEMTQQFRGIAGDDEGAEQLKEAIEEIKTTWQMREES
ncbi:MAG: O-antigen ligase family protein [Pelovirga sp.]